MRIYLFSWVLILFTPVLVFAQQVEVKDDPKPMSSGQERAREYLGERKRTEKEGGAVGSDSKFRVASDSPGSSGTPRFLALHIGTFFSDQGYEWGASNQSDIGGLNAGVDYRLGEWVNSMDLFMRIDYTSFKLNEGYARKLSVSALVTFPDSNSRFPLYFGAGLGPGFFIKQLENESALALDYSLFGGFRLLDVIEGLGLMAEVGLKNHLHLLSDGQFNGVYFNIGTVFAF